MTLKTYSLRLEEEEYEKLRGFLTGYGDPDLNVGYLLRTYIRDLNAILPNLRKNAFGIRNTLAFWSSAFRQMGRTIDIEDILKGKTSIEKLMREAQEEEAEDEG